MKAPTNYSPEDLIFVRVEYPYDQDLGQRPSNAEVMEAWQLASLLSAIAEHGHGERVFHRTATDSEIRSHFEEIHCPEGY